MGEQKKDRKIMSGKYDPPDKARLIAANPSISSTGELMVATAEAKFTPKAKRNDSESRAGERCARKPNSKNLSEAEKALSRRNVCN